jgi:hypothetical protein
MQFVRTKNIDIYTLIDQAIYYEKMLENKHRRKYLEKYT